MVSSFRALAAGVLLAAVASAESDFFVQNQIRTIGHNRMDPLVYPGKNGPHLHTIVGGSKFDADCTTADCLHQSKCSSSSIQTDKSAYWSPALMYKHPNGSMSAMRSQTRIYYFMKPADGKIPAKPFPQGLRMLAGPPSDQRPATYPPRGEVSYDQLQAMDPRVAAIKWGCSAGAVQGQGNGPSMPGQRPYLPNDAPQGCDVVNAGIFYPSCNDGRLDSPDHFDHMRYPTDGSNGYKCPSTHPIKFPAMFMEHFYFPSPDQPYRGPNQDNWILSNGDPTGLTFHADFINGWTPGSLEAIMDQCNAPNAPGETPENCPAIAKMMNVDAADNCRSEGRIVYEEVGLTRPIDKLPGCNAYWPADQRNKPACKAEEVPMGQPQTRWVNQDFKLAIGIWNGTDAENSTPKQSTTSSTAPATTTTTSSSSSAPPSTTSSTAPATTSSASSSEGAAVKDASTTSVSSSTSDYNYGAPPPGATTSAASTTADNYNYGAPPAAATSSSGSSSSTAPTTTASDYNFAAPAPAATSSSASSSSAAPTTSDYNFGAPPPPAAATTSVSSSSPPAAAAPAATTSSSVSSSANPSTTSPTKSINPPAPTTSTSASTTPTPQNAGVVGGGKKPPTCRPKRKGHKAHGQHRRRRFN